MATAVRWVFLRPVVASWLLASCVAAPDPLETGAHLTLAGSTSVLPFAERWAEEYTEGIVTVQAGGSTAGIKAVRDGTAQIGMSSRALTASEREGKGQGEGNGAGDTLLVTVVARDGIAVIVHASNPVRAMSLDTLRAIYTGAIRSWRALGGDDLPITVITREDGSGTRDSFQELVLGPTGRITEQALVTAYSGGLRKMVGEDRRAIGYVTFSQLDSTVRAVAIDGVTPTERTITDGHYRLQRPFVFVTRGPPTGAAANFLEFVLSPAGQDIARAEGLAPAARR
jgi:phosphate transport system substrate-binding protein